MGADAAAPSPVLHRPDGELTIGSTCESPSAKITIPESFSKDANSDADDFKSVKSDSGQQNQPADEKNDGGSWGADELTKLENMV